MRKRHLKTLLVDHQGSLLLMALWVMCILAILAVGIGQSVQVWLGITRFHLDHNKAYYAARAGIEYARTLIKDDSDSKRMFDSLYECGVNMPSGKSPEDLFKGISVGDGSNFDVVTQDGGTKAPQRFGMDDEGGRINLNAISSNNFEILVDLFKNIEIEDKEAREIAASIVDWRDADSEVTDYPSGDEDGSRGYRIKNRPFEQKEELLMVKGVTPEIYQKIADFVTVFPVVEAESVHVNLNLAQRPVVEAIAADAVKRVFHADARDAQSVSDKFLAYRDGPDHIQGTMDDLVIEQAKAGLAEAMGLDTTEEKGVFQAMLSRHVGSASFFRVQSVGRSGQARSVVEAVIDRSSGQIISWERV